MINTKILNRFALLKTKERLAHAYLLSGAPNSGKIRTAMQIAKMLNCEKDDSLQGIIPLQVDLFCDQCPACRKINAGNHPDIHLIQNPEGDSIKIEQIRNVINQAKLRPFQAKRKIFIICNVEHLTREAANALLKTLEEPSASSLLLLTTSARENVLETIQSRCHEVKFFPSSNEALEVSLKTHYNDAPQTALSSSRSVLKNASADVHYTAEQFHFIAWMAEGCPGRAQRLIDEKVPEAKNIYIDQFLLSAHSEDFIDKIAAEKEELKGFLRIVMAWFRDAILLKTHSSEGRLIHLDRLDDLEDFAVRFTVEDLGTLYRETILAYKMVMDNLNVKLPLLILKHRLSSVS